MKRSISAVVAAASFVFPMAAQAACPAGAKCIGSVGEPTQAIETGGARWLSAPEPIAYIQPVVALPDAEPIDVSEIVEIGDHLGRGDYNMVIGSDYYGLPRPPEGTVYYDVADRVLVVDRTTMQVLDDATDLALRGF